MPLSTSTIVFAVATCIPFGLAIRDTAAGKQFDSHDSIPPEHASYEPDTSDEHRAFEELMAANDRIRAEDEAKTLRRTKGALEGITGAEPASLGGLFDGIRIGAAPSSVASLRSRFAILQDRYGIEIAPLVDSAIYGFSIRLPRDVEVLCGALDDQLRDAWGQGRAWDDRRVWVSPTSDQRAVLDTRRGCELRFESYVPAEQWIDHTQASLIPMWAIGQPVRKLAEALPGSAASSLEMDWSVPGVGIGAGTTRVVAQIRSGKVVSVSADLEADLATQDAIIDRITAVVGVEHTDLVWKTNPPIMARQNGTVMVVTIGKRPQD